MNLYERQIAKVEAELEDLRAKWKESDSPDEQDSLLKQAVERNKWLESIKRAQAKFQVH